MPRLMSELRLDDGFAGVLDQSSHCSDALATAQAALQSCLPVHGALMERLQGHFLLPLTQSVLRDLAALREDARAHEKRVERYEAAVARYSGVSKSKDPNTVREVPRVHFCVGSGDAV